ncbi:transcriptional adapter 2B isoform X4 [Lasioglossum baleicum]|uniref:transcriptional adapter 2B isoform X4 n=1 Tax=Lasioglossum baleicum TaxID=434251 RepID=UPI003FCCB965
MVHSCPKASTTARMRTRIGTRKTLKFRICKNVWCACALVPRRNSRKQHFFQLDCSRVYACTVNRASWQAHHNFSAFSYDFAEKWSRFRTLGVRDTQTYGFLACGDVIRIILEEPCRTIMADLYAKYNCTYCQEDITGLRVRCVECPDFDLCLQCFSAGAEIGPHKNDHSYQFMDSGTISIFNGRGNWTAREQLRLLDAIEQFGFGNWEDISKHIETRTPEEAKEEYIARYLDGTIGKHTWPPTESYKPNLTDQTKSDHGPLSPDLTSRLPPLDITPEEAAQLGYMPQRDDFERDYNHEAESLVSSLFLNPAEDDDLDIALKLAQVDMYTNNLRERARRKRVVRDYQLVSAFFASSRKDKTLKKKQSKEEKEFRDRMRAFAQFYTAQEYEQFLTNLERERELRLRLSELYRYRESGIARHEECAHFEQVMAQTQGQNDAADHWNEKKSQWAVHTNTPPHLKKKRRRKRLLFHRPKVHCKRLAQQQLLSQSNQSQSDDDSSQSVGGAG